MTVMNRPLRRLAPYLFIIAPLALAAFGAVRERAARAQGKEAKVERSRASDVRPSLPPNETLLTEEQERALGVKVVLAEMKRGDHKITTGGKVSLDVEHTVRVRPLLSSIIYEVKKRAGDEVKKGDELLVVESTDLGDAKNNFLTALANLEVAAETYKREAILRVARATTETDYHNARAAFRTAVVAAEAAQQKCLLLGVRASELDELAKELPLANVDLPRTGSGEAELEIKESDVKLAQSDDKTRLDDAKSALREIARRRTHVAVADEDGRRRARTSIRAPIDGTLLQKDAARGELIDPSQTIATVSDLSQLWINLDVYQKDIPKVRIGARVDVETPTYPGVAFVGSVTFLSESVDDVTHTLKARVVVDNAQRLLKSGMAAKCTVHCVDESPRIELPPAAIVREGEETFVIVKKGAGHYVRKRVTLGLEVEDAVHVEEGLKEGEQVVQEGNLFIHTSIPLGD